MKKLNLPDTSLNKLFYEFLVKHGVLFPVLEAIHKQYKISLQEFLELPINKESPHMFILEAIDWQSKTIMRWSEWNKIDDLWHIHLSEHWDEKRV